MSIFMVAEGRPGQGKSLFTARQVLYLLDRNKRWYESTGVMRLILSNIVFSKDLEEKYPGQIKYWTDIEQVTSARDVDLIWDEIATELDSREYSTTSKNARRFLSQYRKRGIDIYANTQDFSMIDNRARLMVTSLKSLVKVCGSRDLSSTKPSPRYIWGMVAVFDVSDYKADDPHAKRRFPIPTLMFITKELCSVYDTRQDIGQGLAAPLTHSEHVCNHPGCTFKRVVHT